MITFSDIFKYSEKELDNFLSNDDLKNVTLAEKRYLAIYILRENNLFEENDIIFKDNFLDLLSKDLPPFCLDVNTRIVNVKVGYIRPKYKNLKEWCEDPNNIYIARKGIVFIETPTGKERYPKNDSIWANPFKIDKGNERENTIVKYRTYIFERLEKEPQLKEELKKLNGHNLGCWCHPDPCHGDVLLEAIIKYC